MCLRPGAGSERDAEFVVSSEKEDGDAVSQASVAWDPRCHLARRSKYLARLDVISLASSLVSRSA